MPHTHPPDTADSDDTREKDEAARKLAEARRVGKSTASAGEHDLRDAETFRALRQPRDDTH